MEVHPVEARTIWKLSIKLSWTTIGKTPTLAETTQSFHELQYLLLPRKLLLANFIEALMTFMKLPRGSTTLLRRFDELAMEAEYIIHSWKQTEITDSVGDPPTLCWRGCQQTVWREQSTQALHQRGQATVQSAIIFPC